MHLSWQEVRQGLAERAGIRAGLALPDDRIDHYLGLEGPESVPEGVVRISPTHFEEALYAALLGWCDMDRGPALPRGASSPKTLNSTSLRMT
jgi:hypothetical protein